MKKFKVFIRRLFYIVRSVIPAIIKEFNKNDNYHFYTNFDAEDETFYRKTLNKLGADYRISDYATDYRDRPIKGCKALYVRGTYNHDKFFKAYSRYEDEKQAKARAKRFAPVR